MLERERFIIQPLIENQKRIEEYRKEWIIILTSRIEKTLDPETVEKLPSLEELKREYIRVTIVIRKLYEAELRLREVLFVLNKKLAKLR